MGSGEEGGERAFEAGDVGLGELCNRDGVGAAIVAMREDGAVVVSRTSRWSEVIAWFMVLVK